MFRTLIICLLLGCATVVSADEPLAPIPSIPRLLPPKGVELPKEERTKLEERLAAITKQVEKLGEHATRPDIEIFTKAVAFALEFDEFYDAKKDLAKAHKLLDEAEKRLAKPDASNEWASGKLVVRGYRSKVDASVQPYGIVYPKDYKPRRSTPVFVWLHGRGDKATDMHFINERMSQVGQLGEVDAIVLHPFGRQCVGWKSAGEIDVLDVIDAFARQHNFEIQSEQTALVGFSMGGAGAWHIGAHYSSLFRIVAPGAGFAETARYTNTDPAKVPWYEQKLWGMYDVPAYTRNLFNVEVVAYSGEQDKQIQAARVMEEAFAAEGRQLTHLIGPGVGHKYEPKTRDELVNKLHGGFELPPNQFQHSSNSVQTRTLRYGKVANPYNHFTIELMGLGEHWQDARLDATLDRRTDELQATTKNVTAFRLRNSSVYTYNIDGQKVEVKRQRLKDPLLFEKSGDRWQQVEKFAAGLRKRPGLQGPIDDAFLEPFLVVTPTGKSKHPLVQRWVEFELEHFVTRWKSLMRGELRQKKDTEVTDEDLAKYHVVCFGDTESNAVLRRAVEKLPIQWREGNILVGKETFAAEKHMPAIIYPNPLSPSRYLVVNSGLTFREAHDKTNSQQNPKLPDWAIVDLTELPSDKSPGRIAAAGFFDEEWRLKNDPMTKHQ